MLRLTPRGLGLVTVGVVLLVVASASGLRALAWPGGLLLGLAAAGAAVAWVSGRRPSARRRLLPERVPAGGQVRVELDLHRDSVGLGAWSLVEETVPAQLEGSAVLAVPSGWGRLHSRHHYQLGTLVRGRYRVGPSRWSTTDPLGLADFRRRLPRTDLLTVTPAIHTLGEPVRGSGAGLTGEAAHRRSSLLGPDDALIREYRPRDEVRRIHWASTAHTGTLMVRREEHAWEPSALVLLDNRSAAHTGAGPASSFEWAVSAAASIGVHLLDAGYDLDLADADGHTLAAEGDTVREALLDHLTDIRLTGGTDLERSLATGSRARGQLLVAVLGRLSRADAVALTDLRPDGRLCRAIVLHPADPAEPDPAEILLANGWQVVPGALSLRIADAWAGLGWGVAMRDTDRLGLAVMLAAALSLAALGPITEDRRLFTDCLVMVAVIGVSGIVARRLTGGGFSARLLQVFAGLAGLGVLAAASGVSGPGALPGLVQDALRWTVQSSAPMGPNTGVRLVAVAAIGLLAFLADELAVAHGHAAWTLMPLGVPYLVSALALPTLVEFWPLLWLAVGYVAVLLADAANRNRILRFQAAGGSRWNLLLGGAAMLLSGLLVAVLAGLFTPGLDASRGAPFSGQGPVEMGDPSLDLRRNLQMPVDRPVLNYRTSTGAGAYLRLTSLPGFDATGFHLNAIDLFEGNLPAPQGAAAGSPRYSIDVSVGDFNSEWLPLPYAPASFTAAGQWRHDPQSLSVLAAGANQKRATNALQYQATVIDTAPTAEQLRAASAGYPSDGATTAAVPDDLPPRIRELAETITADAATDGEKALLIQQWLRSSRFSYSTEPAPGSGYEALTRFLFDDRTGYCEQFATSMAVLARTVGIPARVAVGFLPGDRDGDGYQVSIRDMHAWPELFFGGLGWVAFEPTPGVASPPSYTVSTTQNSPSPSASPTPTPSAETEEPSAEPSEPVDEPNATDADADLGWLGWTAGGILVLVAAASTPALLRRQRRVSRLGLQQPRQAVAAAWDEVRDSVWDAGAEWPRGSARQIGEQVADNLTGDAAAAMGRVAVLVERSRYAESVGEVGALSTDVEQVRAGIEAQRQPSWWQRLFPRSLWRGLWWKG